MPKQLTSGQPFDQYAADSAPYCGSAAGNESPAMADLQEPLVGPGVQTPPAVPMLNTANTNMQSMTKGGDKSVPTFGVDEMMQEMGGPQH